MTRLLLIAACIAVAACDMPRDPEKTTAKIRERGTLRVGVTESEPWVIRTSAQPDAPATGIEAELIRGLTTELGVAVEWHWNDLEHHYEAAETFQIDLVAGGITTNTPWKSRVGMTLHHHESKVRIGFPPGVTPPRNFEGLRVAVPPGDAIAETVRKRGAVPVDSPEPFASGLAVAAPEWELAVHGYVPAGEPLLKARHVFAAPPGENRWITSVERHLIAHRDEVSVALRGGTR